jgi:hypothetical protein
LDGHGDDDDDTYDYDNCDGDDGEDDDDEYDDGYAHCVIGISPTTAMRLMTFWINIVVIVRLRGLVIARVRVYVVLGNPCCQLG